MMVATMLPGTDDVPCNFIMLCFLMFFELVAVSYMLNVSFILKSWYIPDFMTTLFCYNFGSDGFTFFSD